jgi:hypothetical protein
MSNESGKIQAKIPIFMKLETDAKSRKCHKTVCRSETAERATLFRVDERGGALISGLVLQSGYSNGSYIRLWKTSTCARSSALCKRKPNATAMQKSRSTVSSSRFVLWCREATCMPAQTPVILTVLILSSITLTAWTVWSVVVVLNHNVAASHELQLGLLQDVLDNLVPRIE